jgi:4-carboxymuconolactone decarboxylase
MLRSPAVGTALQQLGVALRYGGGLAARARELVILVVAAAEDSPFERFAHEAIGRALGLSDQDLESVRTGAELLREDPVEAAALGVARSLIADADLDDATYRSALTVLGERGLFEVTTLVGYYRTLALQLRTFRVGAPDHL